MKRRPRLQLHILVNHAAYQQYQRTLEDVRDDTGEVLTLPGGETTAA